MVMGSSELRADVGRQQGIPLFLGLIAAGIAGNYFNYPIFLNIDFLFGSIFSLLALQYFGFGRGLAAAALIAAVTYALWNHPYAILILTAEVAAVSWLMSRYKIGLVLADALYWLVVGAPLVYVFYHGVMDVPVGNTSMVMLKQAVNGIVNALLARLIFIGFALRSRTELIGYRDLIYNLLAFFALCPALILMGVSGRSEFTDIDHRIRTELHQKSRSMTNRLTIWVQNRAPAVIDLAAHAAILTPSQMQARLEQAHAGDANFLRIGLLDKEATVRAYSPLIDELGPPNIGKNFADRPFIPRLKQTLKPMLSEVVMGRVGKPQPIVALLAPVMNHGQYNGYVTAILSLDQIRDYLQKTAENDTLLYTVVDNNENIVLTNRKEQKVMGPMVRGQGSMSRLDETISQWVPALPPNSPKSERWTSSFYVTESSVGNLSEWKLILEQPVAPFQKMLYARYTEALGLLFLVLLGALALAEVISRRAIATLEELDTLTNQLPARLTSDSTGISWPEAKVKETRHLIDNFRAMTDSLAVQFNEVRQINQSLEQRVEARTAELRQSEARFRELLKDIPSVAVQAYGSDGTTRYWNKASENLYGYSEEEAVGRSLLELIIPPEMHDGVRDAMREMFETGQPIPAGELSLMRKDGSRVPVFSSHAYVEVPGQAPEMFCVDVDLTELKRAEERITELNRDFISFLENTSDFIYFKDANSRFRFCSQTLADITGHASWRDMIDKHDLEVFPKETAQIYYEEELPIFSKGEPLLNKIDPYFDAAGNPGWVSTSKWPLFDADGRVIGLFGISRNVTEQKLVEQELEQHRFNLEGLVAVRTTELAAARDAAEAASRAKSVFLANMSHELRTPMNGIMGMTDLALRRATDAQQIDWLNKSKGAAKHLLTVINDILDLSKIESDRLTLEERNFSLNEVIDEVLQMQDTSAQAKGLQLFREIAPTLPDLLCGDAMRLKQILLNYIGNAIKFSEHGQIVVRARIAEEDQESVLLHVEVADQGIGISPEQQQRLFHAFTQADDSNTRKYGGTGLGLIISKRIANLMGGDAGVISQAGSGSTFWATARFRRATDSRPTANNPPVEPVRSTLARLFAGSRVLVVEDEPVNQQVTVFLLEDAGLVPEAVSNGREALAKADGGDYALILMDVQMPVMNGLDATRAIRQLPGMSTIPILAMTANAFDEDRDACLAAGMNDHIGKPVEPDALCATVLHWLRKSAKPPHPQAAD